MGQFPTSRCRRRFRRRTPCARPPDETQPIRSRRQRLAPAQGSGGSRR